MSHQEENSGSRLREQANAFAGLLSRVGEEQAELLEHLSRVYDARARGLERERTYLEQQLGPEHPDVVETERGIGDARLLARRLAREAEGARAPAPRVTATTWVLCGRIFGPDWEPRPNLAVTLHDEKGTRDDRFGEARTDRRGWFELRGHVGKPTVGAAAAPEQEGAPPVFVHVGMADGTTYRDPRPLLPAEGRADSIQIVLR
jgi:hypothetical protein